MKKKILIVVALLLLCFAYVYFKYIYGWMEFRRNTDTPKAFLNHAIIRRENYTKDSFELVRQLSFFLLKKEDFFNDNAYFDSTQLIIDTIIYSSDFNKLAVLVITKNPTSRRVMPDKKHEWYYDATCYLGIKKNDTISLSWIGPVFTNSFNEQSISNDIREACFRTFVTKDTSDAYEYNLNDIRFWDGSIWGRIEEKNIKKREFEKYKKEHPENVYEPKK